MKGTRRLQRSGAFELARAKLSVCGRALERTGVEPMEICIWINEVLDRWVRNVNAVLHQSSRPEGKVGGRKGRGRVEGEGSEGRQKEGREVEEGCFRENNRCQSVCLIDHCRLVQRSLSTFSAIHSEI